MSLRNQGQLIVRGHLPHSVLPEAPAFYIYGTRTTWDLTPLQLTLKPRLTGPQPFILGLLMHSRKSS